MPRTRSPQSRPQVHSQAIRVTTIQQRGTGKCSDHCLVAADGRNKREVEETTPAPKLHMKGLTIPTIDTAERLGTMPEIADQVVIDSLINGIKGRTNLDSGANSRFIDTSFTRKHHFPTIPLERAKQLGLANGEPAPNDIEAVAEIHLNINGHQETFYAFVTKLDSDYDLILGRGWFNQHEPKFCWK